MAGLQLPRDFEGAVPRAVLRENELVGEVEFTVEDAKRAGLTGKDNWRKYPSDMLWARMISRAKRRVAPDVCMGAYVEGEISGSATVVNGEAAAPPAVNKSGSDGNV